MGFAVSNPAIDLQRELAVAAAAVCAAAAVSRAVYGKLVGTGVLEKDDRSPVTVADFAAQAVVGAALAERSSIKALVGEETSSALRTDTAASVRAAVVERVRWLHGAEIEAAQVLDWIDAGAIDPAPATTFWTLDPIDGTKGFLRGEHYAIALALIHQGQVVLGALACPRLDAPDRSEGVLLTAVRGRGTFAAPLAPANATGVSVQVPVQVPVQVGDAREASAARFCESVEASHSDHEVAARIAARLGIVQPPLRLDSQAKYATVARGDASIYLRLPTRKDYREKIWDHAAGALIVEEAGGRVSDVHGVPLDFSRGRLLEANSGVIATNGYLHRQVVEAVGEILKRYP
jgi:HAL2 family 3'(2'),5'-bisphosphate nucleotidase